MNIFAFRRPGESSIKTGGSSELTEGICRNSFIIAPFYAPDQKILSIPDREKFDFDEIDNLIYSDYQNHISSLFPFPKSSGSKESHRLEVEKIREEIFNGNLKKCVAARCEVGTGRINIHDTFFSLCEAYPEAYIFLFHTSASGTWLGASPELLLARKGTSIRSMALAGTRPANSNEAWSEKNIAEHRIVIDFLSSQFKDSGIITEVEKTQTVNAGPVEHLRTLVNGLLKSEFRPEEILRKLSPTPALSGSPKEKAIRLISEYEEFSRGFYGGFCGWTSCEESYEYYVNLRSVRIEPERYCIFAGGGIMQDSDPESEWEETEHKALTIKRQMKFYN